MHPIMDNLYMQGKKIGYLNHNASTEKYLPKKITVENNILRTVNIAHKNDNGDDMFDEWGEDLPEDVVTECEMLASQVVEPVVKRSERSSTMDTSSSTDIEKLQSELEKARRQTYAKEGEITYLRGELNKKIMLIESRNLEKIEALEKQKEKFKLERDNYLRQIESFKTELEFNKQEVKTTLDKLACREKSDRHDTTLSQSVSFKESLPKRKNCFPQTTTFEAMEVCEMKPQVRDDNTQTCFPGDSDEAKKALVIASKFSPTLVSTLLCMYQNDDGQKLLSQYKQTLFQLDYSTDKLSLIVYFDTLSQKLNELIIKEHSVDPDVLQLLDTIVHFFVLNKIESDELLLPGFQCCALLIRLYPVKDIQNRLDPLQALVKLLLSKNVASTTNAVMILMSHLGDYGSTFFNYHGTCLLKETLKKIEIETIDDKCFSVVSDLVRVLLFSVSFQDHCYESDKFCDCLTLLVCLFCKLLLIRLQKWEILPGDSDVISSYVLLLSKIVHQDNLMFKIFDSCQVYLFEIMSQLILISEDPVKYGITLTNNDISLVKSLEHVLIQLM